DELAQGQRVGLFLLRIEILDGDAGAEPYPVAGNVGLTHARQLGKPQPQVTQPGRDELLPLERSLVLGVLAQVPVRACPLDLLREHEVDLVIQALDFRLELGLELVDHGTGKIALPRATSLRSSGIARRSVVSSYNASFRHAPQHPDLPRVDR